jgi:hypothetical protein
MAETQRRCILSTLDGSPSVCSGHSARQVQSAQLRVDLDAQGGIGTLKSALEINARRPDISIGQKRSGPLEVAAAIVHCSGLLTRLSSAELSDAHAACCVGSRGVTTSLTIRR